MLPRYLFLLFIFISPVLIFSQVPSIISGPFQGSTTTHSAKVWMMVKNTKGVSISSNESAKIQTGFFPINDSLFILQIEAKELIINENNKIDITLNNGILEFNQPFNIKLIKNEISDFSFLAGSCTWPHKNKSKRWNIFDSMRSFPSDFMLWMGDNIYLRNGDWETAEGINNKYIRYRKNPKLNAFLKSQPNFAAWDDHEFGPNDADASFGNKSVTLQAFKDFWMNPSYGTEDILGTFYSFEWQDVEFFVLDGRYYKTDSEMYGKKQMDWLKNELENSNARVKFVVGGSQFLVESSGENWGDHPSEKNDFMNFIQKEKIKGLVFLSGDRHYAELSILDDGVHPKILEITTSPLTSFPNPFSSNKLKLREKGTLVKKSNFARIFLEGKNESRKLRIELRGRKGQLFWEYEILVDDLQ